MGSTLYLECSSGISGDMTVAALLDLGADQEVMKKAIASLPVEGFSIEVSRVKKSGLDACDFLVRLDEEHENHDHDMEYLHGEGGHVHSHLHHHNDAENHEHSQEGIHSHSHFHDPAETHAHGDAAGHHSHPHIHRGLNDILEIISQADLSSRARALAVRILIS